MKSENRKIYAVPNEESMFRAMTSPGGSYCEGFMEPGVPRDHWRSIIDALDSTSTDLLGKRQARIKKMRHEDGATYNLFDNSSKQGTPWALETIPMPVTSLEWEQIEAGMIQRAGLLNNILSDIYGPQELLNKGLIPPELIFANPAFLRSCHGVEPAGGNFLSFYAVDIYRGIDGSFRVLRDYGANPSGLGYALENRIVISRAFSELYHKTMIQRLAPFFQTFHGSLIEKASMRTDDEGIVLLSPGPDSPIYFEHALLSRYLGYPLVEGQDLTVRNGRLYLKKLAGLELVKAVFRHIDDHSSDPFALRQQTSKGVAGIIQVLRDKNLSMVNSIGSGFIDTPVLPCFLESLCSGIMGENLLIRSHPAWWSGTEEDRKYILDNSNNLIIGKAMQRTEAFALPADLKTAFDASPYAYMASEPLHPSSVPVWNHEGASSRYVLMRVFACATNDGYSVMPGGLAITAPDVQTLTRNCPDLQQSKDIWVLSDKPVEEFSLLSGLSDAADFKRGSDLPSRAADNLLWLGRYLERAEDLIRLLRSVFRRLSGETPIYNIPEMPFLLNLLRAENRIPVDANGENRIPPYEELMGQLKDALYLEDKPESVVFVLNQVRESARNVRDRLSLDSWRVINRLEDFSSIQAYDPLEVLDDTLFNLSAFSGLAMESMTRGLGWRFMDMGRRVERAMNQTILMRIALPDVCTESQSALEALLEISDSIMTYRARYRTVFQIAPVLDLLLGDESNPKSLAFQFSQLADHVDHLPRSTDRRYSSPEERLALEMLTDIRLLDLIGIRCGNSSDLKKSLTEFLEKMEIRIIEYSQQISAHYLSRVTSTSHFSSADENEGP